MKAWIFGDSFVDKHFPNGNKKSWADILLENKGYQVNNFAKSGRSTDDAIFCLRDMSDKIDPEKDYVLFSLSNASRFMTIEDIETKYIDTSRHNVDIWQVWTKDYKGDVDILNAMMKLGNDYSNRLKLSIHSNYVKRILDDIGVLRKGAKGDGVKIMQEALGIPADGDFGPGTERALKAWQRDNGLTPDGIAGPATFAKLLDG